MYVNHIVECCHNFVAEESPKNTIALHRSVVNYFRFVSSCMGTKFGDISNIGMSIRYPFSSRAVAVVDEHLPKNHVEIHQDMARELMVSDGDVILAERFPCLGFVSVRPQYVKVTQDPMCKYTVRVSGNSLNSMNLDFDGDTLFLASFHTPAAIEELCNYMRKPNPVIETEIEKYCANKVPHIKSLNLDDYKMRFFGDPTVEEYTTIIRRATGVKSHTGPVIALAYNLMRIVERNLGYKETSQHVALELLLDFLGNTVFGQKHGIDSLQEAATDAICQGDVNSMVSLGFGYEPSKVLCDLIRKEAADLGIRDLVKYHQQAKAKGRSKIINVIVRRKNQIYFASRGSFGPYKILDYLKQPAVDLPSFMLKRILETPTKKIEDRLNEIFNNKLINKANFDNDKLREMSERLIDYIDDFIPSSCKVVFEE